MSSSTVPHQQKPSSRPLHAIRSSWNTVLKTFTPLAAIVLLWYGGSIAHTVVAGLVLITVYPYLSSGAVEETGGDWMPFRSTISDWGQHWHKSCGRIYESEGPDAWVSLISAHL